MKNFPASPKSAFFWRNWEPRCEWPQASKAQALVRDAISLVDGQAHEYNPIPAQKGAMASGYAQFGRRLGEVGRKKLRQAK